MLSLLILASIPATLTSAVAAEDPAQQAVSQSANGEFLAKHYPPRALKAGEQGRVGFRIIVEPDGSLGACDVTESSGSQALDKETCEIIVAYARLQPVRNADGRAVRAVQNGYVNWKLPAGTAKVARGSPSKARDPERIICKRSQTTGSLVAKTKQCLTARQWAEAQRQARGEAERIIGVGYAEDGDGCGTSIQNPAGPGGC
jgi:protein TonB